MSYRTAYAPHFPPGFWDGVTEEEQTADWLAWPQEHPDDVPLAAEVGGQVIGYTLARPHPYHGADGEVLALHVLPEFRGRAGGDHARTGRRRLAGAGGGVRVAGSAGLAEPSPGPGLTCTIGA